MARQLLNWAFWAGGMLLSGWMMAACPPSVATGAGDRARLVSSQRASQFTIQGMTQAIFELEQAGEQERAALQARYERDFKASPQDPFRRFLWAYSLDDRNQAWQELSKVTKLNDRFLWAYLGMGVILDAWKVFDQAQVNFERALLLGPKVAIVHGRFGRMLLRKGDVEKAMAALSTAARLDPERVDYLLDLARAQAGAGREEEARLTYARMAEKNPDNPVIFSEKGGLLARMGERADAVESLARAAQLTPGDYGVRRQRARLLVELDRREEAVEAFRDACRVGKDDECWRELAVLGASGQDLKLQIEAYEQVLKLIPEDLQAHEFLAPVYLEQGAIERALPSFRLVLREKPDDLEATVGLAQIFEKGEEYTKAMESYGRVLELKPEHGAARQALERLFEKFHILSIAIVADSPEKVFRLNQKHLSSIYKLLLKDNPKLRGELLIKVTVAEDGEVQHVAVAKDSVGHLELSLCAVWNLRRSRFPAGFGATYDFALDLKPGAN